MAGVASGSVIAHNGRKIKIDMSKRKKSMSFKAKYLKDDPSPYYIAEIGINHNGRMDLAKEMIDASREAGADAVKFQRRTFDALLMPCVEIEEPTGYLSQHKDDVPDESKAFGTWVYPYQRLEFSDEEFLDLWRYSESQGMEFIVSPWEESSMDFLAVNKANVIKIASIDTVNYQFCEYIASKGIPTITSTGMTGYDQMRIVWNIFDKAGCPMMFLHCTSAYPSSIEDKHLKCIPVMQEMFDMDIGFSGHGTTVLGALGAVALGANVVEKHVTMSRQMSGPDHAASLEFDELAELISLSANMTKALGNARKQFLKSEAMLHSILSKRIVTTCEIKAGTKIEPQMVRSVVTKQEGGILPERYYDLIGSLASKDLKKNHILVDGDF